MDYQNLGFLPDPEDKRDFRLDVLGAAPPVDWNAGYDAGEPDDHNQGTSDACGPYSTSSYHEVVRPGLKASRRDLAARVLLPDYGSRLRDNILAVVNVGQATQAQVPDPHDPTPTNMRDKTGLNPILEALNKEQAGFSFDADIETMARTIRDNQGCIFGLNMTNEGWKNPINPRPPASGEKIIGHALYGKAYHLHDGLKCIIAKSSFGNVNGTVDGSHHHIKENYFASGNVFNNCWTLVPKKGLRMLIFFQVKTDPNKTIWELMDGQWLGFSDQLAFTNYVNGRPFTTMLIDQSEFDKAISNPDVFKS